MGGGGWAGYILFWSCLGERIHPVLVLPEVRREYIMSCPGSAQGRGTSCPGPTEGERSTVTMSGLGMEGGGSTLTR